MVKFDREEITAMKYYICVGVTCLAILLAMTCLGCSTMSIAKQKKAAMLIGQQIEFIAVQVAEKCNSGTLKREDCDTMADLVNLTLDAQNAYVRALIAMQDGKGTEEQVQKALGALQEDLVALISNAVSLGIKIRKEN